MKKLIIISSSVICMAITFLIVVYFVSRLKRSSEPESRVKVLEAQEFILRGEDGFIRGSWEANADGSTLLSFFDKNERPRLILAMTKDGNAILSFHGKAGEVRGTFGESCDGNMIIGLGDIEGRTRGGLLSTASGAIGFSFCDKEGQVRVSLITQADGNTAMEFNDNDGNVIYKVPK